MDWKSFLVVVVFAFLVFYVAKMASSILPSVFDDTPCTNAGCGRCVTESQANELRVLCEYSPYYECGKDCRKRDGVCSFDMEFYDACVACIDECAAMIGAIILPGDESCVYCYEYGE